MNVITAAFHACEPTLWTGRYGRVMGDSAVFHLRYTNGRLWPVLLWEADSEVITCRAIDSVVARRSRCCSRTRQTARWRGWQRIVPHQ